jgi:hypothetical protein
MQCREAFNEVRVLTIGETYDAMAPHFPAGTQVLLTRIRKSADLVPGAVYLFDERDRPDTLPELRDRSIMGRLAEIVRAKGRGNKPFAELALTYDNLKAGRKLGINDEGRHYCFVHFDGYRVSKKQAERFGEAWKQEVEAYRCYLWQVTHYIAPPTADELAWDQYADDLGLRPAQQRWLAEENLITFSKAEVVTAHSQGLDYPPTLEQLLNSERAALLTQCLSRLTAISPAQAQRYKRPLVALTRRSLQGTVTAFYGQQAVSEVLDLLDAMRREQDALAALQRLGQDLERTTHLLAQVQSMPLPCGQEMSLAA